MQGMKFLIVNQDGKAINHGIIENAITPEKYLCQFSRNPPSSRVVSIEEIQGWNLFPTDEAMNTFIATLTQDAPPNDVTTPNSSATPPDLSEWAMLPDDTTPPDPPPPDEPKPNKKKKKTTPAQKRAAKKGLPKKTVRKKGNGK